jgi:hypothetical protein
MLDENERREIVLNQIELEASEVFEELKSLMNQREEELGFTTEPMVYVLAFAALLGSYLKNVDTHGVFEKELPMNVVADIVAFNRYAEKGDLIEEEK